MEITKREILVSLVMMLLCICLGTFISGKIDDWQQDKNAEYDRAARITEEELFVHGMNTNLGNAFVYGELEAVNPVTYPEIGGIYSYVKKVKERYTMHTRTVTYTTGSGKTMQTHTRVETYWTWDYAGEESKKVKKIVFFGNEFPGKKIDLPSSDYIKTIKESSHIRYKYYGVPERMTGTIYTKLRDKTISDSSPFYNGMKIEEVVEKLEESHVKTIFWAIWGILMAALMAGFFYLDNRWLE